MTQGITMDIRAQVVGYEQSLRKLQEDFNKIDPSSSLGRKLSQVFDLADRQLKNLNKNLTPRVTNNNQIDATADKVNALGETLQRVSQLMQGVTASDLNFDQIDSSIAALERQLVQLETTLNNTVTVGFRDAINNSNELSNSLKALQIDINNKTEAQIFDELNNKAQQAQKETKKAASEVQKAREQLKNSIQARDNANSQLFNLPEEKQKLQDYITSYQEALKNITDKKTQMQQGLANVFTDSSIGQSFVDGFFDNLDRGNFYTKFNELLNGISSELQKSHITIAPNTLYTLLFGQDFTGNINNSSAMGTKLFWNLIPSEETVHKLRAEFEQRMAFITERIGATDKTGQTLRLIDEGKLNEAIANTIKLYERAYDKVTSVKMQREADLYGSTQNAAVARQNLINAKQNESDINVIKQELEKELAEVQDKNKNLENRILELEKQINDKKENAANTVRSNALNTSGAIREFNISTEASEKYKAQLDQVIEREKLVGKIEGIVQRWFSIYAAVRMVGNAIRSIVSTIKELDKTITEIAIVTKMDQSELWGQMGQYTAIAREYAASISGVYKVSQLYYQQGLEQADVMALTTETLKMARISGLDYAKATDYMTNAVRSFKMEMTDAQRVVDVYSAIAASSATSVTELASAMSKTASSAEAVGSSFENTTAMMAVMIGNTVPYN